MPRHRKFVHFLDECVELHDSDERHGRYLLRRADEIEEIRTHQSSGLWSYSSQFSAISYFYCIVLYPADISFHQPSNRSTYSMTAPQTSTSAATCATSARS
jgi:hypothetical protein